MPPLLDVCLGDDSKAATNGGQAKFRPEHPTEREERHERKAHGRSGSTERPESLRGHREAPLTEEEAARQQAMQLAQWRQKARARGRSGGDPVLRVEEQMEC
eukprot:2539342-Prymnesium_polylepis.1